MIDGRRRRADWGAIGLLAGSLLICFIVSETILRWWVFGSAAFSYEQMKSIRHIGESGLLRASQFQDVLWELKPNLHTLYKLKPIATNSDGLRDREYPLDKPVGTFRVVVLGDSFTLPEGVSIEGAYHTLLEERFNQQATNRRFEFINFGVPGYSLPQYRATIKHKALKYNPDLIFIAFCAANDSKPPDMDAFNRPYRVKPEANGFYKSYLFEHIGNLYKRFYKWARNRFGGYNADANYVDREFRALAELVAPTGVPVLIAYIDNKAASADLPMIRDAAAKYGFIFIDGTKPFGATRDRNHIIYLTDNHPNETANRLLAEALYNEMQKVSQLIWDDD